ncbi:uncharacterized protein LOC112558470 [Pomacea canaliculata]|uniref:uncharacterized protein LOC112558470 n=1 Tax=Pomacea canaliculata TaxID=400727 RepID=UPI000D72F2B7|nr:uncharacterized protein LOC112558470 [Pomacea canaliculata]
MATCGTYEDTHTECSICLEPYKGPALLSCHHTVCSLCLTSLLSLQGDEFQRATYRVDDKRIEDTVTTVICPVCRNVSTASSPGFTDFQRNVCEKKSNSQMSTVACDLCEEGRETIVHCSQCLENICQQCRPLHDRYNKSHSVTSPSGQPSFRDEVQDRAEKQASIVTAILARLEQEERQLEKQGVALEDDINARCSVGLLEMVKARDKCLSDLKVIVRGHQLRLLEEKTALAARYENLQRIVSSARDSSVPLQTLQAGLLEDEAVHDLQRRLGSATHTQYVVYTKNEDISPHNIVQDFMGSVVSPQNDNSTKNTCFVDGAVGPDESCSSDGTQICPPLSAEGAITESMKNANNMDNKVGTLINKVDSLIAQMDDMKNENKDLQSKLLSLQNLMFQQNKDYRAVRDKHTKLQQEVTSVKESNSALYHDMSSLREQISELLNNGKKQDDNFSELHEDCATSQAKLIVLEQEVGELLQNKGQTMALSQLEKDVKLSKEGLNTLQRELSVLKSSHGQISSLQSSTTLIKNEQASLAGKLEQLTAHIKKAEKVVAFHAVVNKKFTLSSDQVIIADHVITNNGAAYNKTTGIFTAPVAGIYTFLATACSTEEIARVDVIIDDCRVAHTHAAAGSRATCHAIVELKSGQKVCMKTYDSKSITFDAGWTTSFSGTLLKVNDLSTP